MTTTTPHFPGYWHSETGDRDKHFVSLEEAMAALDKPIFAVEDANTLKYALGGRVTDNNKDSLPIRAIVPAYPPTQLGGRDFCNAHGLKYACYAGSMAHGISSVDMVTAMGEAGMLGFFGSAGLSIRKLRAKTKRLHNRMLGKPFGINLINSPHDTTWEREVVGVLLQEGIRLVEASAYIMPTAPLVKYRVTGLRQGPQGTITAPNQIIAKVSRSEIAKRFLEPPPARVLKKLVEADEITKEEAHLAKFIPLAQDITAEADSGGHTDHRSALSVLSTLQKLRDEIQSQYDYAETPRIGLAGGIGTPHAVAAAFAMGAAYIVTGSINQACVEAGTSQVVREMLAQASQTDVTDAPAADMFEQGVKVQVLKKGTRFPERAEKLYKLFKQYQSIDAIPTGERDKIEETIFRDTLEAVWDKTTVFFKEHNPQQIEKAETDPKHKFALICRCYLGTTVHWAKSGIKDRKEDFQIWCGPAMGAFNDWTRDSYLEELENRKVDDVAKQLIFGAALLLREQSLQGQGVALPASPPWHTPTPELIAK